MYRCKECGKEYDLKPDYCDCGNDEFEEVEKPAASQLKKEETGLKKVNTAKKNKNLQSKNILNENNFESFHSEKRTFSVQYPELARLKNSIDPISLVIFCICVLLSFYVIFYAWNPDEKEISKTDSIQKTESAAIPSINKFWNDTTPVIVKEEPVKQEAVKPELITQNIIKQVLPAVSTKPVQQTKQQTIQTVNQTAVQQKKPAPKTTTVPLKKALTSTAAQSEAVNKQLQAQKAAEAAAAKAKAAAEAERVAAEAAQLKKLQEEQAKKAAEEKAKKSAAAKQEYTNYKAQLRNTIGRKIDFTRVIGDGECIVAFKIDSNGKLINRSFAKQSSNNTLNDAVYAAVMATPTFNPPPSAYNNETLRLSIRFYNGNFEISLP